MLRYYHYNSNREMVTQFAFYILLVIALLIIFVFSIELIIFYQSAILCTIKLKMYLKNNPTFCIQVFPLRYLRQCFSASVSQPGFLGVLRTPSEDSVKLRIFGRMLSLKCSEVRTSQIGNLALEFPRHLVQFKTIEKLWPRE